MSILAKVNSPNDLKTLTLDELEKLSTEIRTTIIKKVSKTGGHMGPNLGVVEATIALHTVFNSPIDKFIFDVSHQCYCHKILTGRKDGFINPEKYGIYTGFTAPSESEHDCFIVGHTSTAISLATGVAKARDLKGEKRNVVAIVGDGSIGSGEAFEGLNSASTLGSNFIIVINDNEMSIAENCGGFYKNLSLLRQTKGKSEHNFFKTLGFDYLYVDNGNNISDLVEAFKKVKDIDHPIVVHIHTLKGKGLKVAEENKEAFHWILPGIIDEQGNVISTDNDKPAETYDDLTKEYFLKKHATDPTFVATTAGTPGVSGHNKEFRNAMGANYTDVGICEQHEIAYAAGLAKFGAKPVVSITSSFIQRAYDQLSQELALNKSPATILVYWGAITDIDSTHLGIFDIPLISNIPNIVYLAPTCKEEYLAMLDWSVGQNNYPVAIRVPFGPLIASGEEDKTDYSIVNKYKVVVEGEKVAVIASGNFFNLGKEVVEGLKAQLGVNATLINPRFISGVDQELLTSLCSNHKVVITLEDGVVEGGFGWKIASFYGNTNIKVLCFGAKKEFTDRESLESIYKRNHLTANQIITDVQSAFD